jgi:hypothetical protein
MVLDEFFDLTPNLSSSDDWKLYARFESLNLSFIAGSIGEELEKLK